MYDNFVNFYNNHFKNYTQDDFLLTNIVKKNHRQKLTLIDF